MQSILAIAVGGAIGAVCRHGVDNLFAHAEFPYATLIVNVAGCFAMGVCLGLFSTVWQVDQTFKVFLTVGFLGALTTFSTFAMESVLLVERGQILQSCLYVALSVCVSIFAFIAGLLLVRQVFA